jgi:uncharacterized protein
MPLSLQPGRHPAEPKVARLRELLVDLTQLRYILLKRSNMPKIKFSAAKDLALKEKRQIVIITITRRCNLRCKYCYESNVFRDDRSMNTMFLKNIVREFMESNNGFESEEFQFFGGEPMLEFDKIKDVVEWFKLNNKWKKRFIFFIGTNGTILTDEMKSWLVNNRSIVTVAPSLDGNKIAHNMGRNNSYEMIEKNLPFFTEMWPKQPMKMTIYRETIPYVAESVIDMEERGFNFTANVVYEDIWGDKETKEMLLREYEKQLNILVDYYSNHPNLEPVGNILAHEIAYFDTQYPKEHTFDGDCLRFCGAGHEMINIDVDGKRYGCHRFAPGISKRNAPTEYINRQTSWKPEKCTKCKLLSICPTCAGMNWDFNGDSGFRTNYHCDSFKLEVLATAKLQANRLCKIDENSSEFPGEEGLLLKKRIDAIFKMIENGI